jgi:hypothetical protein
MHTLELILSTGEVVTIRCRSIRVHLTRDESFDALILHPSGAPLPLTVEHSTNSVDLHAPEPVRTDSLYETNLRLRYAVPPTRIERKGHLLPPRQGPKEEIVLANARRRP